MADTAPIELPTGRRSFVAPANSPNIHDKDWIPVLNADDLKKVQAFQDEVSPYSSGVLSALPRTTSNTTPTTLRPQLTHNYSKSSLAPESVTSELEAEPLPPRTSSKKAFIGSAITSDPAAQHLRNTSADAPSSDGQETVTSEGADAPSTSGTASLLEEQYYTLPDAPVSKDDILPPTIRDAVPFSARSSMASTRIKTSIAPPTSKYSRKPINSIATMTGTGRPPTIRSQPTTPHDSPKLLSALPKEAPPIPQTELSALPPVPPAELSQPTPPATPKLAASKSTASERRARALHSHPSNVSLVQSQSQSQTPDQGRSRASSSSSDNETLPKVPSLRHKPRKSTDSRGGMSTRGTLYDAQTPTPAPTTPLPQLPPQAASRRASTRCQDGLGIKPSPIVTASHNHIHSQSRPGTPHAHSPSVQTIPQAQTIQQPPAAHLASPLSNSQPAEHDAVFSANRTNDHTEMASFMTNNSTVVFRRFDDVHVKLLLCLQHEISQLERELMRLDGAASAPAGLDKGTARMKIMRELRRVVAEYDHLFANWSQMQANKTTDRTRRDLKEWLEKPMTSAGASLSAREDARWLGEQKDLSTVNLNGDEKDRPGQDGGDVKSGGGGGGIAALFGCATKRK